MKKRKLKKELIEWGAILGLGGLFLLLIFILPAVIGAHVIIIVCGFSIAHFAVSLVEWWFNGRKENNTKAPEIKTETKNVVTVKASKMISKIEREVYVNSKNYLDLVTKDIIAEVNSEIEKYIKLNKIIDEGDNLIITASLQIVENGGFEDYETDSETC